MGKARPTTAWAAWGETDPGRVRENNEDRIHCDPERGIFIVVDGMGGEAAGEEAAARALVAIRERLHRETGTVPRRIREAVTAANNEIYRLSQTRSDWRGMACVLTVAVLDEGSVHVGHVGDTRLYVARGGQIRKATPDHSPIGKREDRGELSELEAMRHPRRNEVYRDVGSDPHKPEDRDFIEYLQFPFEADSALLLCSDGLSDMLTSSELLRVLEAHAGDPHGCALELIRRANAAGGKDNVSAIVVEGESFASGRPDRPAADPAEGWNAEPYRPGAESSGGPAVLRVLTGPWAMLLYGAIATFLALSPWLSARRPQAVLEPSPTARTALLVEPGSARFPTISSALQAAGPGDRIEVTRGEYREVVRLKDDVALVARHPGEVVLELPRPPREADAVVLAEGIRNARLAGFVIRGVPESPAAIGIKISSSDVEVTDFSVSGMTRAGVWIDGDSRTTLIGGHIHSNPGTGIVIAGEAAPRVLGNLVERNGEIPAQAGPGIDVTGTGVPDLVRNLIAANAGEGIRVRRAELKERFTNNFFGAAEKRNRGGNVGLAK